ncbi:hypothetical protein AGOR_G00105870 [Albula goreensis]|uniref:Uncharacterized protein n=1 Tax=Albula goreensis TaxID=1534307 RepID=A0A8T3DJ48_9TELE|nr:hypothetical protein AGOR_G00105870 [Albula goreensis]
MANSSNVGGDSGNGQLRLTVTLLSKGSFWHCNERERSRDTLFSRASRISFKDSITHCKGLTLHSRHHCRAVLLLFQYDSASTKHKHFTVSQGDQRCVYVFILRKRAVAQLSEPVWGKLSLQARSLQPQWQNLFHVRDRVRLQSFMSSTLLQTEDTKKLRSKVFLSY